MNWLKPQQSLPVVGTKKSLKMIPVGEEKKEKVDMRQALARVRRRQKTKTHARTAPPTRTKTRANKFVSTEAEEDGAGGGAGAGAGAGAGVPDTQDDYELVGAAEAEAFEAEAKGDVSHRDLDAAVRAIEEEDEAAAVEAEVARVEGLAKKLKQGSPTGAKRKTRTRQRLRNGAKPVEKPAMHNDFEPDYESGSDGGEDDQPTQDPLEDSDEEDDFLDERMVWSDHDDQEDDEDEDEDEDMAMVATREQEEEEERKSRLAGEAEDAAAAASGNAIDLNAESEGEEDEDEKMEDPAPPAKTKTNKPANGTAGTKRKKPRRTIDMDNFVNMTEEELALMTPEEKAELSLRQARSLQSDKDEGSDSEADDVAPVKRRRSSRAPGAKAAKPRAPCIDDESSGDDSQPEVKWTTKKSAEEVKAIVDAKTQTEQARVELQRTLDSPPLDEAPFLSEKDVIARLRRLKSLKCHVNATTNRKTGKTTDDQDLLEYPKLKSHKVTVRTLASGEKAQFVILKQGNHGMHYYRVVEEAEAAQKPCQHKFFLLSLMHENYVKCQWSPPPPKAPQSSRMRNAVRHHDVPRWVFLLRDANDKVVSVSSHRAAELVERAMWRNKKNVDDRPRLDEARHRVPHKRVHIEFPYNMVRCEGNDEIPYINPVLFQAYMRRSRKTRTTKRKSAASSSPAPARRSSSASSSSSAAAKPRAKRAKTTPTTTKGPAYASSSATPVSALTSEAKASFDSLWPGIDTGIKKAGLSVVTKAKAVLNGFVDLACKQTDIKEVKASVSTIKKFVTFLSDSKRTTRHFLSVLVPKKGKNTPEILQLRWALTVLSVHDYTDTFAVVIKAAADRLFLRIVELESPPPPPPKPAATWDDEDEDDDFDL